MNQELKEKIHYYLPHGLKVAQQRCGKIEVYDFYGIKYSKTVKEWSVFIDDSRHGDYQQVYLKGVCPLFRPLSSLTKEIVVEGYNDGKPFVPVIDLLNIRYKFDSSKHTLHYQLGYVKIKFGIQPNQTDPILNYNEMRLSIDQWSLLFQWHFWIGDQALFDTGEIIRIEN